MTRTQSLGYAGLLALLFLAGCRHPVNGEIDSITCSLAAIPRDVTPPPIGPNEQTSADQRRLPGSKPTREVVDRTRSGRTSSELLLASFEQPSGSGKTPPQAGELQVPSELPFSNLPPIALPPVKPGNEEARRQAVDRLFPALRPLGTNPEPQPGPNGHPLTLGELEKLALATNPAIKQAVANVTAARGAYLQAGLHPNPTIGYESDTVNTSGGAAGPGYQGGFIDQPVKTAGKLQLAREVAEGDLHNQEIALRKAEADLLAQVRGYYFAVLVAQENMKVSLGLARFTDQVYRQQVELVKGAQAAAYEPYQLRVLVFQTRANLVQARNRYISAWKQLAASIGEPLDTRPTQLGGRVDMPIPVFDYDRVLALVTAHNTDVLTAQTTMQRALANVNLTRANAFPDFDFRVAVQEDYTSPPHQRVVYSVQAGIPLPIWDRNQGNILQAEAQLVNANEEGHRVRLDLMTRLDDAFERYDDNRVLLQYYRLYILPDQIRAYRGVYERYRNEPVNANSPNPHPTFGDVVTAQQTLTMTVTGYVTALGNLWQAVTDVAHLLQTDDLYGDAPTECVAQVPDLEALLCTHPCSPLVKPNPLQAPPNWPAAEPPSTEKIEELKQTPKSKPEKEPAPLPRSLPAPESPEDVESPGARTKGAR